MAYVLIGGGFVIADMGLPDQTPRRWLFIVPGTIILIAGCAVFLCAIGHGTLTRARATVPHNPPMRRLDGR